MRCGIPVGSFWEMTPRETFVAMDAANWRTERQARHDVRIAWLNANWQRAKRMPSLKSVLTRKESKPLNSAERDERKQEFKKMASPANIAAINEHMKKLKVPRK